MHGAREGGYVMPDAEVQIVNDEYPNEFAVTIKLHNNLLRERRQALGLRPRQLAGAAGVSYYAYLGLENLHASPYLKNGKFRDAAIKLAGFHKVFVEDLFPESICEVVKPTAELKISARSVRQFAAEWTSQFSGTHALAADLVFDKQDAASALATALETLSSREARVLCLYHGLFGEDEHTHREIGKMPSFDVSGVRIRQIKKRAMLKLRRGPRAAKLISFLKEDDVNG